MLTRVTQRYLVATIAFAIAAVVTGIGLVAALESLLVFSLVYVASAAYQQRAIAASRRRRRPARRPARVRVEADDELAGWPSQAVDWPSATWNG